MSDLLLDLFHAAMDRAPYIPSAQADHTERALEERLDAEGRKLLARYTNALSAREWEKLKWAFYTGLAPGMEFATFTPFADACRRP